MNLLLLADIVSLVLLIVILVLFVKLKRYEEKKFNNMFNAIIFGLVFIIVYVILDATAILLNRYNYSSAVVIYSNGILVAPLAAIFFFVSVLLNKE